ncbi:MAG: hypothetical protein E7218_03420 [Anaerofustis stercorihominis]|nr:hypothetical protein [Anaerofustis stercorihominis]
MKKKTMAIVLVVCLLATALVSGTLAYFTDTDEATNVFTMGNVQIVQNEQQRVLGETEADTDHECTQIQGDGLETFEDNKVAFPAVLNKLQPKEDITVNGYDFTIRKLEGNYIDKIVNVYNTGSKDAYVRTIIAIPNMNGYDDSLDASENPFHWNYLDATDFEDGVGWDWNGSDDADVAPQLDKVPDVTIGGKSYDIYVATYNEALAPGAFTSPSMVGFYLHDTVNYGEHTEVVNGKEIYHEEGYFFIKKDGSVKSLTDWIKADEDGIATLDILVATQAVQTEGFDDAWEALDEAFKDITKTNHPWIEE